MAHHNSHTEKELLTQVSEGDEKAFRDLFESYYEKLYHYVFGFIKSKQVSECSYLSKSFDIAFLIAIMPGVIK